MTNSDANSENSVLRLTLATLVAFLLTNAVLLAFTSAHNRLFDNPYKIHQLQGEVSPSGITAMLRNPPAAIVQDQLAAMIPSESMTIVRSRPNIPKRSRSLANLTNLSAASSRHHPEKYFADAATETDMTETNMQVKPGLSPEQLKINALSALRTMPDYFPSDTEYEAAVAHLNKTIATQQLEIDVNTFLLSQRISDDSRLSELQMQPFFAEFDQSAFSKKQDGEQIQATYNGVGFPHIESNNRSAKNRYKPYKQLMSFSDDASGEVVPYVRCMGLSPQRVAKRAKRYDEQIAKLSEKYQVSASLIKAVVAKESCFNPKARSPVGAIGLMQLMPATARWLKVKQPENPQQNLAGGVRYLAQLREQFGDDELALAAYNAGPGNVERYRGIPPFDETENYVVDVMHFYRGYAATTHYVNAQNTYYYP